MLDTGNVLLSYRKSYFWSPTVILVYRKYLWNVSYAIFTPFHIYGNIVKISRSVNFMHMKFIIGEWEMGIHI